MMRRCLYTFILAIFVCGCSSAAAADVSLQWDPSESANIKSYRLYVGSSFRVYSAPLDVGNKTSYTMTNLAPGSYHVSVSAVDTKGAESDYSNEVAMIIPSGAGAKPVLVDPAGNSGSSGNTIGGVVEKSRWKPRLRPSDNIRTGQKEQAPGGKLVFDEGTKPAKPSDDLSAPPADRTAPEITNVATSRVTSSTATITWTTSEPANSRADILVTASRWARRSGVSASSETMATNHSLVLTGLEPATEYRYRVTSADAEGNSATSEVFKFKTEEAPSMLVLPRFPSNSGDIMTGMSIINQGSSEATLSITAIDASGNPIAGPKNQTLAPGAQASLVDREALGALPDAKTGGWIKVESASRDLTGSFLAFNGALSFMSGTNVGEAALTNSVLTGIRPEGDLIHIVNPNAAESSVTLELVSASGTTRGSQVRTIKANGALVADLYGNIFSGIAPEAGDYVRIGSTQPVQPFVMAHKGAGDNAIMAGQDAAGGKSKLYASQYYLEDAWKTGLSVVNLDGHEGTVMLRFIGDNGAHIATKSQKIPGYGKIQIDDPAYFVALDPGEQASGYVEVASDGVKLAGTTAFGDKDAKTFSSALALAEPKTSIMLSQVSADDVYFTGLAVVNPNSSKANVTIALYGADGKLVASREEAVAAGNRVSRMVTDYFPEAKAGYIRVTSDQPVTAYSTIGTKNLSVLSAAQ